MICSVCLRFKCAVRFRATSKKTKNRQFTPFVFAQLSRKRVSLNSRRSPLRNTHFRKSLFQLQKPLRKPKILASKSVVFTQRASSARSSFQFHHAPTKPKTFVRGGNLEQAQDFFSAFKFSQDSFLARNKNLKISCFRFSAQTIEKNRTIELTWGETATAQRQGNEESFKREAVSPSRPMICSTSAYFGNDTSSLQTSSLRRSAPTKNSNPTCVLNFPLSFLRR